MVRTLPPWLTIRPPSGDDLALFQNVSGTLKDLKLYTICETGKCPNRSECWGSGTATFLLMGDMCTRRCHFCNCGTAAKGEELQSDEPGKILQAVKRLNLSYVVLTSVARDDLPDQGSLHIAATIRAIKTDSPNVSVEALIPDFQGNEKFLANVANSGVDVLCHNIEVVKELQKSVRDYRAGYEQSLAVLSNAKKINPELVTKSSIMLGLGETAEQIGQTMDDLRKSDVDALTIGQYLQPNQKCLPVKEFITPEKFEEYKQLGMSKGFKFVVAGPFVRSSYKAAEALAVGLIKSKNQEKGG